ncbi:MAG: carboxypeptidase-like regulatory domain-containing protein [Terracidiphilus sp.]
MRGGRNRCGGPSCRGLRGGGLGALTAIVLVMGAATRATAQEPLPQALPAQPTPAPSVDRTLATLHGVVLNAATGEGVPRALVEVEGDAEAGVLTGGDGRFEIPGVPVGPQAVEVRKPGFLDESNSAEAPAAGVVAEVPHNILVAAEMPDVAFTLTLACAIRGQIDLSTGDPAIGIEVGLVRRTVMDGRAVWQASGFAQTRSDGTYRFGGLANGQYELYTTPTLDSEPEATLVAPGKGGAAERWGYASVFYPSARDPSGAARIAVANGEEAQANFTLTREPFETVTAAVTLPQAGDARHAPGSYSAQVMDGSGNQLPYTAQYDQNSHTVQAALPDGSYSLLITSNGLPAGFERLEINGTRMPSVLVGEVDFAVAGHAVTNLRVPLSAPSPTPVEVSVIRGGAETVPMQNRQIAVMLSQAGGWMGGGITGQYASGSAVTGTLEASYMAPGAYWVHAYVAGGGLCESSFTAGGANLGREPVLIGLSGATAPMELALRDDCAQLTVSLPEDLMGIAAGEEPFYVVYVVPDFDFSWDIDPAVLRPSTSGTYTLDNMTPGNYHVYTFKGNVQLEYRNPAVLAALPNPGQAVTLSPGVTSSLVLEVPGQ